MFHCSRPCAHIHVIDVLLCSVWLPRDRAGRVLSVYIKKPQIKRSRKHYIECFATISDYIGNYTNVIYPILHMVSHSDVFLLDQPAMRYTHYTHSKLLLLASTGSNCREAEDVTLSENSQEIKDPKVDTMGHEPLKTVKIVETIVLCQLLIPTQFTSVLGRSFLSSSSIHCLSKWLFFLKQTMYLLLNSVRKPEKKWAIKKKTCKYSETLYWCA